MVQGDTVFLKPGTPEEEVVMGCSQVPFAAFHPCFGFLHLHAPLD